MYQYSYAEMLEDTAQDCRTRERELFDRAIELLQLAQEKGNASRECVEALLFLRRLWTILVNDLNHPENGLPAQLRGNLVSIGLWVLKEAEQIRLRESDNFAGLIEINAILRDGLH